MFDYWVSDKMEFSARDKRECFDTVKMIVSLGEKVRKYGILELENEIPATDSILLKAAIRLIVDGVYADDIRKILQNYIVAGNYRGGELLNRILIMEGMLAVQQGSNPKFIREELLASYFGEDFMPEYMEHFGFSEKAPREKITMDEFLEKLRETQYFKLDGIEIYEEFDDYAIQILIREISRLDLARVFKGSPENIIKKFVGNMSERNAEDVMRSCISMPDVWDFSKDACAAAQNRIWDTVKALEKSGQIRITKP